MFILLAFTFFFCCEAREKNTVEYGKTLNVLLEHWIAHPTLDNYRNLNFYLLANKPSSPISDTTESVLLTKINAASMKNECSRKTLRAWIVAGSCIIINPEAIGCTLIGCAITSGNLLRTCHQDNKKSLAEELKIEISTVCKQSRIQFTSPQTILMKKNDDEN